MTAFTSSVWDRLIAPIPATVAERRPLQLTLAQYKRAIARDLEALLNTTQRSGSRINSANILAH